MQYKSSTDIISLEQKAAFNMYILTVGLYMGSPDKMGCRLRPILISNIRTDLHVYNIDDNGELKDLVAL